MNKKILISLLLMLCFGSINAQLKNTVAELNFGYSKESLQWSIEGNGINILSELKYKPIHNYAAAINLKTEIFNQFTAAINIQYIKNFAGQATDADYNANDRNDGIIANFNSNAGNGLNIDLNGNYKIFNQNNAIIAIGIGLLYKKQLFTLNDPDDNHLVTTYKTNWKGGYFNAIFSKKIHSFEPFAAFQIIPFKYDAIADWIFRNDFKHPKSFEHKSWGIGGTATIGSYYQLPHQMKLKAECGFGILPSKKGTDIAYLLDRTAKTTLNKADLKYIQPSIGIQIPIN